MSIDYANLTPEQLARMSDEDFAKLDPSRFDEAKPQAEEQTPAVEVPQVETPQVEDTPAVETPPTPQVEQPSEATPSEPANEGDGVTEGAVQQPAPTTTDQTPPPAAEQPPAEVTAEKAFFDKVTGGFQANGKEYKIDNADDAVKLMQMGLNYNQKMATMKPGLKLVKALQERGIESVEQLAHLLDIHDKKPEAIAKLVQDSGLDTYAFEEQAKNYVPQVPTVTDAQINFEMAAQALEHNPHFATVVQNLHGYDDHTKQEIFNNPHLLNVLTDHVQNGYYNQIVARLEQERAVGRIPATASFLQAYDVIGQQMFAQQQPAPVPAPAVQQVTQPVVTAPVAQPVPVAQKVNPSNNAARQAAAGITTAATQPTKVTMTPEELWSLSDEEFAKLDPKFL